MVADRVEALGEFAARVYGAVDETLASEMQAAVSKTVASVVGAHLAFLYLNRAHAAASEGRERLDALRDLMLAGV